MTKIDELLAVLDMPEREQCKYFYDKIDSRCVDVENIVLIEGEGMCLEFAGEVKFNKKEMADLAFRLRDETDKHEWETGLFEIYEYLASKQPKKKMLYAFGFWKSAFAQPIHWIIASLIAKELKNDSK